MKKMRRAGSGASFFAKWKKGWRARFRCGILVLQRKRRSVQMPELRKNYQQDDALRGSFNALAEKPSA